MIPALANHFWQSTVFAAAAGLLTLAFRKNRAQVRYGLWLAASVKFLLPFALLVDIGTRVNWAPAAQAAAAQVVTPPVSFAAEQAAQPFVALPSLTPVVHAGPGVGSALLAIWACGCLAVIGWRLRAWRRVRAAVRASTALDWIDVDLPLQVRSTPRLLEPGVVGIWRPVLMLPAGIAEHLSPPELDAVLAHERCHVRRHDNLFAAVHMVVETLFWFYPPVWWIGARMVEERERACDEGVLSAGGAPQDYASAIVSVCKFYVESPLACMSGFSGADLRQRIEAIMVNRLGKGLTGARRMLLACATIAALTGPAAVGVVIGLGHAPVAYAQLGVRNAKTPLRFTVESVKPSAPNERGAPSQRDSGFWSAPRTPVTFVIGQAFGVSPFNDILGAPGWAHTTHYDFQARMPPGTSEGQFRLMLQSLLADRFQMKAHIELRPMDVAILTAGTPGPDLHPASRNCVPPPHAPNVSTGSAFGLVKISPNMELAGCSVSMAAVADFFTKLANHPVVDETGLKGLYDIDVTISGRPTFRGESRNESERDAALATKAAFQKQLGLNLDFSKLVKRPMPVLVIDHLAPASAN